MCCWIPELPLSRRFSIQHITLKLLYCGDLSVVYSQGSVRLVIHVPLSLPPRHLDFTPAPPRNALCIAADITHLSHSFLLLSGGRLQRLWGRTSRLKDSFVHQAARMLNSPSHSCPMRTACGKCVLMVLYDDGNVADLAIIRSSLSVPAWTWGN